MSTCGESRYDFKTLVLADRMGGSIAPFSEFSAGWNSMAVMIWPSSLETTQWAAVNTWNGEMSAPEQTDTLPLSIPLASRVTMPMALKGRTGGSGTRRRSSVDGHP